MVCREASEKGISIHAPRVGSDSRIAWLFVFIGYFNPRSPCGERLKEIPNAIAGA